MIYLRKQKSIGNEAEEIVANFLSTKGHFVIIIPQTILGQPFDLVSFKDNQQFSGDVKNVQEGKSFSLSRIEPNQLTSFQLMLECGNNNCGVFVVFRQYEKIAFFPYDFIKKCFSKNKFTVHLEDAKVSYNYV